MSSQTIVFDPALIRRYDTAGPRYTSYPTAVQFHPGFGEAQYRPAAEQSGGPLSLYFHLPFCDTVCFYCACNKIITRNRTRAAPYLETLHHEIVLQSALFGRERMVKQLHWGGGTPTFLSHDEMRALMATTRRYFALCRDDQGEYSIEIDPREIRAGTLPLLRELGFNRLSMGVQDFDLDVQKAVNRIQSEEQTLAVLQEARELGFRSINMDLIYGLPRQTVASFACTLDKIVAANPDRLSIFNYAHMPSLFKTQRQIRAEDLPSPQAKLEILQHTIERLTAAGYVYIGMDHFARPDDELAVAQRNSTLHRNFQGYSTHADCDLVGLGITAIGRVGKTYSQNHKTMEAYEAAIREGRLPIMRGVALDADDLLRRHIIMQLICNFSLDTQDVGKRFGITFEEYFAPELTELNAIAQDGLLEVDANSIQVRPAGKLLIRNICMVFDKYLRQKQAGAYSKVI